MFHATAVKLIRTEERKSRKHLFNWRSLNKLLVCIGVAVFVFCIPMNAQSTNEVTEKQQITVSIDEAAQRAITQNVSIKQNQITLMATKRAENVSWNSISPSVSASGNMVKQDSTDFWTLGVSGTLSLALSPSLYTSIKAASLAYEQGKLTYDSAVKTIELNVRKSFLHLLYETENIEYQKRNVASAKRQYESNLVKYNNGTIPQLDVLNSQVSLQNLELTLQNSLVTLESDLNTFKQLLGLPLNTELNLKGSLSDISATKEITLESLEINYPSLKTLECQLDSAKNALLATRFSAYGPTLSFSFSYNLGSTTADNATWNDSNTITVGAKIPLDGWLPWSVGAQSIAKSKDTINNLTLQIEDTKTTLESTTKNILNKIEQSRSAIGLRKKSIELAEKTYNMTYDAYNHGTRDYLSLQNSADSLVSAQVNLLSELYNFSSAVLDLENTIGVPFGTLTK